MRIAYDERGLKFKHGEYRKLLRPGNYPGISRDEVIVCQIDEPLHVMPDLAAVLSDPNFVAETEIVNLRDHNIALVYQQGNFATVLGPGTHAFWKTEYPREFRIVDLNNPEIDPAIDRQVLRNAQVGEYVYEYGIEAFEIGLLLIERQLVRKLEPGNYFFWHGSKSVSVLKADLRQQQLDVSGQEIMTKDKVALRLNFVCQYRVVDATVVLLETKDFEQQLYAKLQLVLREYIGARTLDEILDRKEEINAFILDKIKTEEKALGIEIVYTGIKDVILPGDVKEIINQVLIAEKRAQANVITRREETASTRSLLNTAKLMGENEILLKLKELEYVEKISDKINQISVTGGAHIVDQLKELFTQFKR